MNKTEQLSTSTQKPKIELPNKELVGVKPTKKKEINESSKLPNPTGWTLLVLPFKQKEKTSGGIILADDTIERSQVASTCGLVLSMARTAMTKKDTQKVLGARKVIGLYLQDTPDHELK